MLLTILSVLSGILLLYGMYYVTISVTAFLRLSKKVIPESDIKNKFKVIVACRNEEKVIGKLIESLKKQNYPKDMYEICVIPNNCTDKTEEIAKNMGARIIKCDFVTKCKGDALRQAFDILSEEDFDAYAIFDADNVVHPNFLKRMNDAIENGFEVAQGYRDTKNPSDNWISGSYYLYYAMQNFFFNKARFNIHKSATINGTGYMVKKDVISKYGFDTKTMTEDIEFTAQCAINNVKIGYVEDAITYDEQPIDFKASWKQRKRWSIGAHTCFKIYHKDLLKTLIKNKNISGLDLFMNFLSPVMQVIGTIVMLTLLIFRIKITYNLGALTLVALVQLTGLHICLATYVLNVILNIFLVIYDGKEITDVVTGILLYTFFIITWIPINFISIFAKEAKWEEIKHTRCVDVSDIVKS